MNFTNFGTLESVTMGYVEHLIIILAIAIITPLFTYFGLRKELKIIEQLIAILLVFLTIELLFYLFPFIINNLGSIF